MLMLLMFHHLNKGKKRENGNGKHAQQQQKKKSFNKPTTGSKDIKSGSSGQGSSGARTTFDYPECSRCLIEGGSGETSTSFGVIEGGSCTR
eukprot:1194784-Prorocentrum_minimum.AAC.2